MYKQKEYEKSLLDLNFYLNNGNFYRSVTYSVPFYMLNVNNNIDLNNYKNIIDGYERLFNLLKMHKIDIYP